MRAPQLDNRLKAAMDMVRNGSRAADVGTDHGRLALQLVLSGKCPIVYAIDLREAPLEKAKQLVKRFQLEDKIICELADGLRTLSVQQVDDIVIAGMGGETIVEILESAQWVCNEIINLVLVPAGGQPELRRYLFQKGFSVEQEIAVKAKGRCYAIINAKFTGVKVQPSLLDIFIGKIAEQKTKEAQEYIEKVLRIAKQELNGKKRSNKDSLEEQQLLIKQLEEELAGCQE